MSININLKRVVDTLSNLISGLIDQQTGTATNDLNETVRRVGSTYFINDPNRKTTNGTSFTYLPIKASTVDATVSMGIKMTGVTQSEVFEMVGNTRIINLDNDANGITETKRKIRGEAGKADDYLHIQRVTGKDSANSDTDYSTVYTKIIAPTGSSIINGEYGISVPRGTGSSSEADPTLKVLKNGIQIFGSVTQSASLIVNQGGLNIALSSNTASDIIKFGADPYALYIPMDDPNIINSGYTRNNNADTWINYSGYLNGVTQFRTFRVGDGKRQSMLACNPQDTHILLYRSIRSYVDSTQNEYTEYSTDSSGNCTIRPSGGIATLEGTLKIAYVSDASKYASLSTDSAGYFQITPNVKTVHNGALEVTTTIQAQTAKLSNLTANYLPAKHATNGELVNSLISALGTTGYILSAPEGFFSINDNNGTLAATLTLAKGGIDKWYVLNERTTPNYGGGATNALVFYNATNSAARLTIQEDGKTKIGTGAATEALDVTGNIKASSLAGSGNRAVYADSNGKLYC